MDQDPTRKWQREKISESLLNNARKLRRESTPAEDHLWFFLRNRKLAGYKFRRQQPLEGFIIDFYCDDAKLGVEVDGLIHTLKEQLEYDEQRTKFLSEFGIKIIRFANDEVIKNTSEFLNKIKN
jgi:very-short-patch-repair endonuclease